MTQEEILDYNRRCAEFLFPKAKEEYESGEIPIEDGVFKKGMLIFEHYDMMRFHSDWNWIMDLVEAIEKLGFNVRITIACITIENAFDNDSNLSPIYKFHSMQGEFESKKEAVVQAINQFLIWYEQNK